MQKRHKNGPEFRHALMSLGIGWHDPFTFKSQTNETISFARTT